MKGRKYRYILVLVLGSLFFFVFISVGFLKSISLVFLIINKLLLGLDSNFNRLYIDNRFS